MLVVMEYDRRKALMYAERWALSRNPLFENYSGIGGDCTNFVSQSIYAGSCVMNYTPTFGWYYISPTDRAAAWTGVTYFYNFLTSNEDIGPYGSEVNSGELEIGDVIQLMREDGVFYHSLLVTGFDDNGYLVSSHSNNALNRPLSSYNYAAARYLHIEGIRIAVSDIYAPDCFDALIAGIKI